MADPAKALPIGFKGPGAYLAQTRLLVNGGRLESIVFTRLIVAGLDT
jgi:hypothetical protein